MGRQDYLDAASACARFVWESMRDSEGRLRRTWKEGEARLNAYLEDHAFLVEALLRLQMSDPRGALVRCRARDGRFDDRAASPTTSGAASYDLKRPRGADCPPQGRRRPSDPRQPSSAAYGLLRLSALTGERAYERAAGTMRLFARQPRPATQTPSATCSRRSIRHLSPVREIALVARRTAPPAPRASPSSPGSFAPPTGRTWYSPVVRRLRPPRAPPRAARSRGQARSLRLRAVRLQGTRDRSAGSRRGTRLTPLENRQEVLDLVWGDPHPVVLPLRALDLDEPVERVLAEDPQDQLRPARSRSPHRASQGAARSSAAGAPPG